MVKWRSGTNSIQTEPVQAGMNKIVESETPTVVYAEAPENFNFFTLQNNLQSCLSIIDNEVMKKYVSALQNCSVVPVDDATVSSLEQIQFFRISELVYQEDEFSVHKLATIFNALSNSNKPCTLVLMIQSDGQMNNFYLGVRPRGYFGGGTMRQLLEQSFLGQFPGSSTDKCIDNMEVDLEKLRRNTGAVSSVTCIAGYKQEKDTYENKNFIQGLEKLIYSMQGKAFTAIFIANNLDHNDVVSTRKEYERIYTLMSPFANMQYNYALNKSSSMSDSNTQGITNTNTSGITKGTSTNFSESDAVTHGTNLTHTITNTEGSNSSVGLGNNHTIGTTDGVSNSETTTKTVGAHVGIGKNAGVNIGVPGTGVSFGTNMNTGISASVSRGKTHGTSHTDSISDSISQNLTFGINASESIGYSWGENESSTKTRSVGSGTQYSENEGYSLSTNYAYSKALTDTFGSSQAVTLNVQNKSIINIQERLEKQLERLDECESIGMWDFAAYFLGESAAETGTAASIYRSIVSGNQSGLEMAAINTWTDEKQVKDISKYVVNFMHPVFLYKYEDSSVKRQALVDATTLASTNEIAIQLGLPRKSVRGLPVIEHALFAQEVLSNNQAEKEKRIVELGSVSCFGKEPDTEDDPKVDLDLESLSMHTFITGSTGSGKSNTVYQMLSELLKNEVHFLVIEPAKGEYKKVFGGRNDVSVYGTNPLLTELLRINPFSFPKEVHIYEHLDRLVEIFNVCWPMYAAMPAILKDAIERSYIKAGWDLRKSKNKYNERLFPNFIDVLQQIDEVMDLSQYSSDNKGDYKGALSTRLRSLTNGINGLVFTTDEIPAKELFDKNVIIDLSRVGSTETKSLIMGLLVMKLQEYRMATCDGMNVPLKHVTVLEEAHNLLKRTSTEQSAEGSNLLGKSVEMLTNAIAEMRTYGEGFIIADQAPGLLDMAVIRNTNTKIIMRLPEYSDRELVGHAVGLKDDQIVELSKLNKGVAAIYQNDWTEAVLCKVKKFSSDDPEYNFEPVQTEHRDIKGEIISRLLAKDWMHLIDTADEELIVSNISAAAKCRLFDYASAPCSKKFYWAASIAYELFFAEAAFSALEKKKCDFEQQKRFIIEHLTPSIAPLPKQCSQLILYLVTYWNARESALAKTLLDNLIKVEQKESVVK